MTTNDTPKLPILFNELDEVRNELVSIVMRMEKVLRTADCGAMRIEVKKLRELVK